MFRSKDETEKSCDLYLCSEENKQLSDKETIQLVKFSRKKLCDYYGSATSFFPAARADLIRVESMSAEEIILEAKKLRLI